MIFDCARARAPSSTRAAGGQERETTTRCITLCIDKHHDAGKHSVVGACGAAARRRRGVLIGAAGRRRQLAGVLYEYVCVSADSVSRAPL